MGIIFDSPLLITYIKAITILLSFTIFQLYCYYFTQITTAAFHTALLLFSVASIKLIPHKYPSNPIPTINNFIKQKYAYTCGL